jgi:hypothetical protein
MAREKVGSAQPGFEAAKVFKDYECEGQLSLFDFLEEEKANEENTDDYTDMSDDGDSCVGG